MTRDDHAVQFSRRGVLASAAAGALAGGLGLPALASAAVGGTTSARRHPVLRIGVIGCGGRGTGAAVQALRADPDTQLVAMGDTFADRLNSSHAAVVDEMGDEAKARIDVPESRRFTGFDAYEKVINAGVDVVLLTSYPCFRPTHLQAAVAAGKHVFAEKPIAVDSTGVRACLDAAAKAQAQNTALLVGFCWRFHPGMREAVARVHAGDLGDIATVYTNYHTGTIGKKPRKTEWSDLEFQMRNWWHFTWISGDHIVEQAVHSIDRLAWVMRDKMPTKVIGLGGRAARSGPEHGNVFDHFSAIYEYDDGRRAFHTCTQIDGFPGDNKDYLYGSKGLGTLDSWGAKFPFRALPAGGSGAGGSGVGATIWDGSGNPADSGAMYQIEHNEMFASIRAGKPMNNGIVSANSCLMAIMARMAAYTGKTVTWEQALNARESLVPAKLEWGAMDTPAVAIPGRTKIA